ncbi:terminase large subunit domain-containing protein [Carnimonas bestiolae]|uniref:terminase large subunit domain-containing protein n=1 Tax=Carnimonas bestiolae TaxID=3402172 RepID=UPI003EDCA4E5
MATLNNPQADFIELPHKFRAFVAGFGSGKTWVGCTALCIHAWQHPRINMGYFAPTYPQIRDIFYPTIEEVAHSLGLIAVTREANREVHLFEGSKFRSTIKCRSMDKPGSIVGFKIGHALADELDVMSQDKAQQAWRKIIARMRYNVPGVKNGVDVTTTPEGFRFVYQQFVKAIRDRPELSKLYGLIQASTYDNAKNLPADYIESLKQSYPSQLIEAYLRGQFVNLASGAVYARFNRDTNNCQDVVQPGEPIYIGVDFNVSMMAAVICVKRDGEPRVVDEIMGSLDTPDLIRRIKERFWLFNGSDYSQTRHIYIYPDASGGSRKSVNASTSDLAQFEQAGMHVRAPKANPPVKDRINAVNAMICNGEGIRRLLVNRDRCPTVADNLQQQVWAANGEPDKTAGNDHSNDALGYFIAYEWPVVKPTFDIPVSFTM